MLSDNTFRIFILFDLRLWEKFNLSYLRVLNTLFLLSSSWGDEVTTHLRGNKRNKFNEIEKPSLEGSYTAI